MARSHILVLTLLCAAMLPGCMRNTPGDDTQGASTSTSATTSGNPSGSVTSATDGASNGAPTGTTAAIAGTSDDTASTSVPCNFICDDYPKPACDVFAQDCPEGQKCAAYIPDDGGAWNDAKCVPVTGTDKPGEMCTSESAATGVDSCIEGAMCWGVNQDGVGTCVALCAGSAEAPVCDAPTFCYSAGDGALNLCLKQDCDPLLQDCLLLSEVCYPFDDLFICTPGDSDGEGQARDPCDSFNVCDEGLMCAKSALVGKACAPDPIGCCTPFCKFPDGACPNPDQQCVQYFDPMQLPPNDPYLNIGYCGVPG